ncbi:pyrimidine-nucleoside phosphorylase [Clostridium sp. CM028]|uniref:pyrimidine-nucleoside phosphorylase n=1 Tax=unclassified Clostridium TaxID=2614128 RepID=UPI001C0C8673|nr:MULTISPECIES: pyrimidine-nucleoside phosphorylase [unclassified Clostridium]MBU3090995.1 pyrimidine-nucleoside phosphorylase [Clostridium sp. CF011]MBW9145005.1 pyrimidine-nucleoside phosphorylase [Clostridium sp. CM027]MBW9148585.1 pyrimidine-nucleoside phosphorylase [Clostridium sp. CM028]UVE40138.1 pyrimidine-nucleoside phosphorylase [Clostridium sp. CM027]WAG69082.1 pyrimidine-nucleoside phosphorylase [Clostridium sp. CF011]
MRMNDLIIKKRNGNELTTEEINFFVGGYTDGTIPDYQVSALLMAIYFQKMNKRETKDLTMAMVNSGETIDLSSIEGVKVDKHSTGGVGDTTTLILGPIVAAAGVPVAKMSGRGLGHTGGTIDKLESFEGFSVAMSIEKFMQNVNKAKIAIGGQTADLAPADKKIYALRDVTGTVDNMSLIAGSIMSKKIASGADAIVLDVKTGSGAFMKNEDDAFELAREMVDIGTNVGRNTIGVITDMDQPLGYAVGNALEVKEAIDTLKGEGPEDLTELCLTLGAHMLVLGGKATDAQQARKVLVDIIKSGKGIQKLRELVVSQGGNPAYVDDPSIFPVPAIIEPIISIHEGYVKGIKADDIGKAALVLGAGRETKESKIDLSVGIVLHKKIGDFVNKGEAIATVYASSVEKQKLSVKMVLDAYEIVQEKIIAKSLIKGIVTKDGTTRF